MEENGIVPVKGKTKLNKASFEIFKSLSSCSSIISFEQDQEHEGQEFKQQETKIETPQKI